MTRTQELELELLLILRGRREGDAGAVIAKGRTEKIRAHLAAMRDAFDERTRRDAARKG
jgi:hypothetical protein